MYVHFRAVIGAVVFFMHDALCLLVRFTSESRCDMITINSLRNGAFLLLFLSPWIPAVKLHLCDTV